MTSGLILALSIITDAFSGSGFVTVGYFIFMIAFLIYAKVNKNYKLNWLFKGFCAFGIVEIIRCILEREYIELVIICYALVYVWIDHLENRKY